jgi:hypothetical protein
MRTFPTISSLVLLSFTALGGVAHGQSAAPQAEAPAPVYTPTSLEAAPGLPRTPEGRPDFQGVVWAVNFFPVFQSSPMARELEVPEAQAAQMTTTMVTGFLNSDDLGARIDPEVNVILGQTDGLPIVRGQRRTRQVVLPADGRVPYTAEARAEVNAHDQTEGKGFANYEERPSGERCLSLGGLPPMASTLSYSRLAFVQTRDHVVIHAEQGDEARIIPFAAAATTPGPAWLGQSQARWEGDTLVIETTGLRGEDRVRTVPSFVVGTEAKVVERFTRLSADELLYQYTVIDPAAYTAPWLAEFSFHRSATGMFPSPCHEHNYSLPNILKGARMAEERGSR